MQNSEKGANKDEDKVFAQDRPYNLASSKVGYVFMTYRLIYVFITLSSHYYQKIRILWKLMAIVPL